MNKKPRCHNCKFAGQQFKIKKLTHLHCVSPKMEKYYNESQQPSAWESLRVFNDTCEDHQFKITEENICPLCDGEGQRVFKNLVPPKVEKCPACFGKGYLLTEEN